MSDLNRYDMEIEQSLDVEDPNACVVDIPDDDGDWVKYDDAMAAIAEARQQWPVGSLQWAIESGRPFRRVAHRNDYRSWRVATGDAERTTGYELLWDERPGESSVFALDYELEPEPEVTP